jgi:uncharacterized protein YfaS (alpha-2-macroglobulin family)
VDVNCDNRRTSERCTFVNRARTTGWYRSTADDQTLAIKFANRSSSVAEHTYGLVQMLAQDLLPGARDRGCIVDTFSV